MNIWKKIENVKNLRVIKTARKDKDINEASKNGFTVIVKKVEPSPEIRAKYAVVQNKNSGEITVIGDFRNGALSDEALTTLIDWTYYYPHNFRSPFAAYIIPEDVLPGERVYVEDLIEDFIGAAWNQGDKFRLESCEAIWNGTELEIQYDPRANRAEFMG